MILEQSLEGVGEMSPGAVGGRVLLARGRQGQRPGVGVNAVCSGTARRLPGLKQSERMRVGGDDRGHEAQPRGPEGLGTYCLRGGHPRWVSQAQSLSTAAGGIPRLNFKIYPLAAVLSLDHRGTKVEAERLTGSLL